MTDQTTTDIELGTQVTSAYGQGIVTWVEGPMFTVLMYGPIGDVFAPKVYKVLSREQIDFWPPRKPDEVQS
jgi:hypothetical protein